MKHNIYFHIPKTGGHTVWSAIRNKQVTDIEVPESYTIDDVTWHYVHFAYPKQDIINKCNSTGGTVFISLRDPATQLISFYNMVRIAHINSRDEHVSALPLLWNWTLEENNLEQYIKLELLDTVYSFPTARLRYVLPYFFLQDINHIKILNQESLDTDIRTKLGIDKFQSENVTTENAKNHDGFQIAKLDTLEDELKTKLYKFLEIDYYWYNKFQEEFK